MPKMSKFRKELRMANKIAKFAFRQMDFNSHSDAFDRYQIEGSVERSKKIMHKDNRGQHVKPC